MVADYASKAVLQAAWEGARRFPGLPGRLPPVLVLTDPRAPEPDLSGWPGPVGLVYRHHGAPDRVERAHAWRQRTFAGGHSLLIGDDPALALAVGADGVHFRRNTAHDVGAWRARVPDWILTRAAPKPCGALSDRDADALDAVLVSSVFGSRSPSAGTPVGIDGLKGCIAALSVPVYALGGVHAANIHRLPPGLAGVAGVSFREGPMTDDLTIEKHARGADIRFTATHPDHPGLEAELDLKGAGEGEYAATHTGVPTAMEGRGVGSALYRAMVADARETGYKVIPVCPFIVVKAKRDTAAHDVFVSKA